MRKATKRKHRPGLHPLDAITACQPFPEAEVTRILIKVHDAFAQLRNGSADVDLFDRMAAVLNVGMVRCEAIGQQGVEVFKRAKRFGFTGPGLVAMRLAIALYEEILRASTPRQMADAQQECIRRISAGQFDQAEAATAAAERKTA
jgi:hypothetical protein